MKSYHSPPIIIGPDRKIQSLKRLSKVHTVFDENYLQELLADHPKLLPVQQIRSDVGELLCIGREVNVGDGGSIDNLYISTGGYPVVVETKLWRNPQARREVLSQVLDYVKEVVKKDYEWLAQQWSSYSKLSPGESASMLEELNQLSDDELDEQIFIDKVNRALDRGDVLALIVGDGIETRLQSLVSHICRDSAHLRYSLALVELACYHLNDEKGDNHLLVVPKIIQEVEPIQRAYVRVDIAEGLEKQLVVTPIVAEPSETAGKPKEILSQDEFLGALDRSIGAELRKKTEEFYNDLINSFGLEPDFKIAAVMLKIPDPNGENLGVSVIAIERQGRIYNTQHIKNQLGRWGFPEDKIDSICKEYWNELHEIDPGFLKDGILHLAQRDFIPISRIVIKFDQIKSVIGKLVTKIRKDAEYLS